MKNTGSPLNPPRSGASAGKSGVSLTEHLDRIEGILRSVRVTCLITALESLTAIREEIARMEQERSYAVDALRRACFPWFEGAPDCTLAAGIDSTSAGWKLAEHRESKLREQITGMQRSIEWMQAEKHSAQAAEERALNENYRLREQIAEMRKQSAGHSTENAMLREILRERTEQIAEMERELSAINGIASRWTNLNTNSTLVELLAPSAFVELLVKALRSSTYNLAEAEAQIAGTVKGEFPDSPADPKTAE